MPILDRIQGPQDLKGLSFDQLAALAGELRARILEVTGENGGHLASNLGVVELTIALHLVYDCPKDKLIFDVGHQCYAHKLLTGRRDRFQNLRKKDGLSGFPRMEESPFDAFGAGHSGTAISAALGYARARSALGQDYRVVALVGDGSFMNGPSMEAFNDAGHSGEPLVVVLNDNEMSIDRNEGALARYLTRLRARPGYQRAKRRTKSALDSLPLLGRPIKAAIQWSKRKLRRLLVEGEFFEDLGFSYLGPVDGHDLPTLVGALRAAKEMERPVLLHVLTTKGKGFEPAQVRPERYHGVSPNGAPKAFSYAGVVGETLCQLGARDKRLCVITAAMREGTGTERFARRFPERFYDVGIAESHAVTMAAAMAAGGLHPHFVVYSTFLQRGYDQILQDVALQGLPARLLVSHMGLVGEDGATHNGGFTLSYLLQAPGMTVLCPSDSRELSYLLTWAQAHVPGPLALCYGKQGSPGDRAPVAMELAAWPCLREGQDAALCCVGETLGLGLSAAELLERQGVRLGVYNARQLKPLPEEALEALQGLPTITLEENAPQGGLGGLLALALGRAGRQPHLLPLGLPDRFVAQGTRLEQLESCGLLPEQIADRIARFLREEA